MTLVNWQVGQSVTGRYCGIPYTGKLNQNSRNSPDYRNWIFGITLDSPIEVFGSERTSIEIWSNSESNTCEAL